MLFMGGNTSPKGEQNSSAKSYVATPPTDAVLMVVASDQRGTAVSQGSGFIISDDGLAGSNYHVIKGATQAFAQCCGDRIFEIHSIEGADLERDLVLFQLFDRDTGQKPHGLPHVILGSADDVSVGGKVVAVGSPQGLQGTVSDGILSAVREYNSIKYLKITAPISPGSSGGPVLNVEGKMVGVATFQFEKGQNLNFAVAAEHIRPLLNQHIGLTLREFATNVRPPQSNSSQKSVANKHIEAMSLRGEFGGVVHNTSVNQSAGLELLLRDDNGVLSGCAFVEEPLFGSGPVAGFINDQEVNFLVSSSIGEITFIGQWARGSLSGTYTVVHEGRPNEQGTFTLQKIGSKLLESDFDTTNCPTDAEVHKQH